ncbi:MAG: PD-(D/E)XK nuclease family protein [Phycisphaerales bacterium]
MTATDLADAEAALADAAKTLAIVAEAHASGGTPAWVKKDKALAERAGAIAQTLKPDAEAPALFDTAGVAVPRVRGPLTLSYTQINEFERCPGCWYVKTQMKLERTPSMEISTGVVVHEALCEFFGRWADADAQGVLLPGLDELLVLGRARFIEATEGGVLDKYELERCEQMLRTAFALHARSGDQVHIIERPELEVRVPVQTPSGLHTLYACIDRLEQLPGVEGAVRIVDYKTGKEWKKLTEPPADDLQMGIYSMAVDHFFGGGAEPPPRAPGVAEYWLLATGAVGSIGLDKLNMKKVRSASRTQRKGC